MQPCTLAWAGAPFLPSCIPNPDESVIWDNILNRFLETIHLHTTLEDGSLHFLKRLSLQFVGIMHRMRSCILGGGGLVEDGAGSAVGWTHATANSGAVVNFILLRNLQSARRGTIQFTLKKRYTVGANIYCKQPRDDLQGTQQTASSCCFHRFPAAARPFHPISNKKHKTSELTRGAWCAQGKQCEEHNNQGPRFAAISWTL